MSQLSLLSQQSSPTTLSTVGSSSSASTGLGDDMHEVKRTKAGYYCEVPTSGVKSVIVRGKDDKWDVSVPNHKITGAYWHRVKGMSNTDLSALAECLHTMLTFIGKEKS